MTRPRALYVLGAPGAGKTTTLDGVLTAGGWVVSAREWGAGLMRGAWMTGPTSGDVGLYLGRRREVFGGTDALGMATHPHAIRWINDDPLDGVRVIVGEGARLGTVSFLFALAERTELTVVLLTADPDALDARLAARAKAQDYSWRRGAQTRADRALAGAALVTDHTTTIDTTGLTPDEVVGRVRAAWW